MIYSKYSGRAFFLLVLLPLMLTAQRAPETVVPLKNWASPLYWRANQAEREAGGRALPQNAAPQLQFSTNQVSGDALTFVAITPCRLVDTRGSAAGFEGENPFNGPSIASGGTATFPVQSSTEQATAAPAPCGVIPSIAEAYSLNITVIPHSAGVVDYISLWPAGAAKPFVSTLNDLGGSIVSDAAIVPAGSSTAPYYGGVSVYNSGPAVTDVIIDMNGFFAPPTDLSANTAIGVGSLANTSGSDNTAVGADALMNDTTGSYNTATGGGSMAANTSGYYNTASGIGALEANTSGSYNTAIGVNALYANNGTSNTAFGFQALNINTTGSNNLAFGESAGHSAPATNSYSVYVGSPGTGSDVSGTIQIGTEGANGTTGSTIQIGVQGVQTGGTTIAGISGMNVTGSAVYVNSSGQLGIAVSSGRFKEDITDMGDSSSKLFQLRPVTYFYKPQYDDGSHLPQYGLIAEDVAKVYPEMVAYGNDGKVLTVKYQLLAPMLLNEVQKQHAEVQKLNDELDRRSLDTEKQNQRAEQQDETIQKLQERLAALEALLGKVPTTTTAGQ
jgi:hypothetical protein